MEFKTVKYEPECCNDDVLSGFVILKKPSINDLFEGSEIAKSGETNQIKSTKDLLDWSKKFYAEVKIENSDGNKYSSFDELLEDAETFPILNEVAMALVQGVNRKKYLAINKGGKTKKH